MKQIIFGSSLIISGTILLVSNGNDSTLFTISLIFILLGMGLGIYGLFHKEKIKIFVCGNKVIFLK